MAGYYHSNGVLSVRRQKLIGGPINRVLPLAVAGDGVRVGGDGAQSLV